MPTPLWGKAVILYLGKVYGVVAGCCEEGRFAGTVAGFLSFKITSSGAAFAGGVGT